MGGGMGGGVGAGMGGGLGGGMGGGLGLDGGRNWKRWIERGHRGFLTLSAFVNNGLRQVALLTKEPVN